MEPADNQQTQDLVDHFTPDTPQSHHCGFIAQQVQQTEEHRHAVVGGEISEDGKETIKSLNCNAILTYTVKAIQEQNDNVKKQQEQLDHKNSNLVN